jgi:hypothetical protein
MWHYTSPVALGWRIAHAVLIETRMTFILNSQKKFVKCNIKDAGSEQNCMLQEQVLEC